jgi:hypothetical protein
MSFALVAVSEAWIQNCCRRGCRGNRPFTASLLPLRNPLRLPDMIRALLKQSAGITDRVTWLLGRAAEMVIQEFKMAVLYARGASDCAQGLLILVFHLSATSPAYAQQHRHIGWLWLLSRHLPPFRAKPGIQTDRECHPG